MEDRRHTNRSHIWLTAAGLMAGLLLCSSLLTPVAHAAANPRLFIFLVDGLHPADITDNPVLTKLSATAAVGLMNTRTANRLNSAAAYLSLGVGTRVDALATSALAYDQDEPATWGAASDEYTAFTGKSAPPNSIVVTTLAQLLRANPALAPNRTLGWLGEELNRIGATAAILGNADFGDLRRRPGALLLMNAAGVVPAGWVARDTLRFDKHWPLGWRTDYPALAQGVAKFAACQLVALELGDLARLDTARDNMSDAAWMARRREVVAEIADFISTMLDKYASSGTAAILVSPTPRVDSLRAGHWLAPVIFWAAQAAENSPAKPVAPTTGLLYSNSTRTPGILTNLDIAPAILALLSPTHSTPLRIQPHASAAAYNTQSFARLATIHSSRTLVLQSFVIGAIVIIILTWLALWLTKKARRWDIIWPLALLFIAAFPLTFLLLPAAIAATAFTALASSALLSSVLAWLCWRLGGRTPAAFCLLFTLTTVALTADIISGSPLIRNSFLGFDAMVGARYYGIGNEYTGVLLASALLAAGIALDYRKGRLYSAAILFALVFVTVVVGAPFWGANNGGGLSAVAGFAAAGWFLLGRKITARSLLAIGGLLAVSLVLALVADFWINKSNPSHLGLLYIDIKAHGIAPLLDIVQRKLAMNWKLMKYTIWTKVLVVSLAVCLALLYRPTKHVRDLFGQAPRQLAVTKGALVTALIALLVNDSGVVAAATAMIPITTYLLFVATSRPRVRTEDLQKGASLR